MTRKPPSLSIWFAALVAWMILLGACNGGQRPTLVEVQAPTPEPPLQLQLLPAPDGTPPLPATAEDFPLEAAVDDALFAWANDRAVPYRDQCRLVVPEAGELCGVPTERETVWLLGPSGTEHWYVVTIARVESFDLGTGYRVASVEIAG